ncbi:MAG TPA: glycogen/starch/alpha-glucan phosphorylase [Oscillospiraceae bacterium]|nr:glycogen/starch/alpha-glucan phosphorylase [Oscillospiraceae bacterium]
MSNTILPRFKSILLADYHYEIESAAPHALHVALSKAIMESIAPTWLKSEATHSSSKRAYYLSAEFLVGRAIYNNLLALGLTDEVNTALKQHGTDLNALEDIEDAALGNGGLGRLAACFLDSAATQNVPLDGYGIRYKYGLFEQKFVDGFQVEEADNWTVHGDPWSIRKEDESVTVKFAKQSVCAVPYDMPIIGYGGKNINTLRLWQSEPLEDFDFNTFNDQKYDASVREKNRAEDISRVLYPNDNNNPGKALRIKQQYFFCSASIQDILRRHIAKHGTTFNNLSSLYAIQLNDTHPTIAICELIRILCDDYAVDFEKAFSIAQKAFNYTNHTVMAEAMEKWDTRLYKRLLPRVFYYIEKVSQRQIDEFSALGGNFAANLEKCKIINGKAVHMANLAIYGTSAVNGVAQLHTEILIRDTLKHWYDLYPERFQNKTNGITQRRWLALCNPELSALITRLIGSDKWITDLDELEKLRSFEHDDNVLDKLYSIKQLKKQQLSDYIKRVEGIEVPPHFVFDIQIKRLHEYKRQLLNAFSILDIYFGIKDGRIKEFTPTAFIFGAKAAPGYIRAKGIIKLINEIARIVNADKTVNDRLRVVFVHNYNVSYAERLVCAADLSEQISTAGTEASGTGNMKFMLNGTPTLGTYDGANVEIVAQAGIENNYIFGARVEQLDKIFDSYDPKALYKSNPRIKRVVDSLVDGTVSDNGTGMFKELYDSLLDGASWHGPDHYYLLGDFEDYLKVKLQAISDYSDKREFSRKALMNIAGAGKFSSDRTIIEYAKEIWGV